MTLPVGRSFSHSIGINIQKENEMTKSNPPAGALPLTLARPMTIKHPVSVQLQRRPPSVWPPIYEPSLTRTGLRLLQHSLDIEAATDSLAYGRPLISSSENWNGRGTSRGRINKFNESIGLASHVIIKGGRLIRCSGLFIEISSSQESGGRFRVSRAQGDRISAAAIRVGQCWIMSGHSPMPCVALCRLPVTAVIKVAA
jgi:hypothetical protein